MGFAFAMFVGLVSGIYSTVFIATALVYDTQPKAVKGYVTQPAAVKGQK
jgi:preprotein translocase subunit SecF